MNKIVISGRLTNDVTLRTTQGGKSVSQFGVADSQIFNGKKQTKFWNVVAWAGTAETIQKYFSKGDQIVIFGNVRDREYTDKDGIYKTITEVMVENFEFGAKKQTNQVKDVVQEELGDLITQDELPF